MTKKRIKLAGAYLLLLLVGLIIILPLFYLFFGTFKTSSELFTSQKLLPENFYTTAYVEGWKANVQYTYKTFFLNTLVMTIPTVIFTVLSSSIVAYGFARFNFRFKKPLFALMIATLMLPNSVIIIPRYMIFNSLKWLNTYLPFYIPALLACYPFHIFMLVQFLRGLPKELDESAYIDGCNSFTVFVRILIPLMKPALFTVGLMQMMAVWNDFFNPLIYINSVQKYPLSLALRMSLELGSEIQWPNVLAMSLLSISPLVAVFFLCQKYFVEGIATSGLKG